MQTALHILNLVTELKREFVGGQIESTEFYKKERAAYFFVRKGKNRNALAFIYHPVAFGYFMVPAGKIVIQTREKPWPIFGLDGSTIVGVEQIDLDRLFRIDFEKDSRAGSCLFEAIGPNGNLWHLDSNGIIQATLRHKKYETGQRYEPTAIPDGLNPFDLTLDILRARLSNSEQTTPSLVTFIEKEILGFNRTMAKEAVRRSGADFISTTDLTDEHISSVTDTIRDIAERFRSTDSACLYEIRGSLEAYPFRLGTVETQPEKFKSLSLAVMAMSSRRKTVVQEVDREKEITDAVRKAIKKLQRRIPKIESDIETAGSYDLYRLYGELLQINLPKIKKGMTSIRVENVYSNSHDSVEIKLDPALPPHENVEAYFRKHRKGREGLELLQRRLEITRQELAELDTILTELETNFESASEKYKSEIDSLLPRGGGSKDVTAPRLPYREYYLSTGLKIFVGRDGSDNDRTTFEYARPYELWFHTQQCPGSHVVIKYPNKSFEPSKREIEETAAIAAFFSKAKNDSLVPVIYAERRYVRKPRGAKPGLVTVEREKSVMVAPIKPQE